MSSLIREERLLSFFGGFFFFCRRHRPKMCVIEETCTLPYMGKKHLPPTKKNSIKKKKLPLGKNK